MNADKDLPVFFGDEPPGQKTNAIRWLQKKVMEKARKLPRHFETREEWEGYRAKIRAEVPRAIGIPRFPPLKESFVRARIAVSDDVVCERVDIYVDDDYAIPAFVFVPSEPPRGPMPALVWNPGWPQNKWQRSFQQFGARMARQAFPRGMSAPGPSRPPCRGSQS